MRTWLALALAVTVAALGACTFNPTVDANGLACKTNAECPPSYTCLVGAGICCDSPESPAACLGSSGKDASVDTDLGPRDAGTPDNGATGVGGTGGSGGIISTGGRVDDKLGPHDAGPSDSTSTGAGGSAGNSTGMGVVASGGTTGSNLGGGASGGGATISAGGIVSAGGAAGSGTRQSGTTSTGGAVATGGVANTAGSLGTGGAAGMTSSHSSGTSSTLYGLTIGPRCYSIVEIRPGYSDGCDAGVETLVGVALPGTYDSSTGIFTLGNSGSLGGGLISHNTGTLYRMSDTSDPSIPGCTWYQTDTTTITMTAHKTFTAAVVENQSNIAPACGSGFTSCTSSWTWAFIEDATKSVAAGCK